MRVSHQESAPKLFITRRDRSLRDTFSAIPYSKRERYCSDRLNFDLLRSELFDALTRQQQRIIIILARDSQPVASTTGSPSAEMTIGGPDHAGYVGSNESRALDNTRCRRAPLTAQHAQLVLMCLQPRQGLVDEANRNLDQFVRIWPGEYEICSWVRTTVPWHVIVGSDVNRAPYVISVREPL